MGATKIYILHRGRKVGVTLGAAVSDGSLAVLPTDCHHPTDTGRGQLPTPGTGQGRGPQFALGEDGGQPDGQEGHCIQIRRISCFLLLCYKFPISLETLNFQSCPNQIHSPVALKDQTTYLAKSKLCSV